MSNKNNKNGKTTSKFIARKTLINNLQIQQLGCLYTKTIWRALEIIYLIAAHCKFQI